MKKIIPLTMLLSILFAGNLFAENENQMRAQAGNDMKMARELMLEAKTILQQDRSPSGMKAAAALYTRAGQTLERAMNIYSSLVPDHASEEEVENARGGVQFCISSIQEIQKHMPQEALSA